MSSPTIRLLAFTLVIGGGVLSPAHLFSAEYRMLATFYEEPRATLYTMDTSGTLTMGDTYLVGWDAEKIAASPNGQLIIVSSGSSPQITAFFVNMDGTLAEPKAYDWLSSKGFDPPISFHPTRSSGYAAFFQTDIGFRIDYQAQRLVSTTCTMTLKNGDSPEFSFSMWSGHLYYRYLGDFGGPYGIRGAGLSTGGCFTTTTAILELPWNSVTQGFTVSPDGRWAVALGGLNPKMSIASIQRDGSLVLHQQFSFAGGSVLNPERVRFTHDGRYLILLSGGPEDLISYRLNPDTGLWEEVTRALFVNGGFDFSITPDNRFLVWIENTPGFQEDGYYYTTLQTIRINDDGSFTRLEDRYLVVKGYPAALEFIPPWRESYPNAPHGVMAH